jgi:predicted lipid-binding transport protein (Tim44 family)
MDVIILLICAFIIISRLVKMLGQFDPESDRERRERYNKSVVAALFKQKYAGNNESQNIDVINPEILSTAELRLPEPILKVLQQIRMQDPEFDFDRFLNGAKKAYVMVAKAISESDKKTLGYLLDSDMYEKVLKDIEQSSLSGFIKHNAISEIESIEVIDAALYGDRAMLTVDIKSKQLSYSEDSKGNLISGSKDKTNNKTSNIVFSRYLTQENIWRISKMS